ncbi:MAG: hypothetical protein ACRC5M_04620 [Anaeroplasmataceae bacterium]
MNRLDLRWMSKEHFDGFRKEMHEEVSKEFLKLATDYGKIKKMKDLPSYIKRLVNHYKSTSSLVEQNLINCYDYSIGLAIDDYNNEDKFLENVKKNVDEYIAKGMLEVVPLYITKFNRDMDNIECDIDVSDIDISEYESNEDTHCNVKSKTDSPKKDPTPPEPTPPEPSPSKEDDGDLVEHGKSEVPTQDGTNDDSANAELVEPNSTNIVPFVDPSSMSLEDEKGLALTVGNGLATYPAKKSKHKRRR